jgi:hypothetical protein
MNRRAAVVFLSLVPFVLSAVTTVAIWDSTWALIDLWRMILAVLGWVAAFALGTRLFWKVVLILAPKSPA